MRKIILPVVFLGLLLVGCAGGSSSPQGSAALSAPGGGTNAFNPYMQSSLPNMRSTTGEGRQMLGNLGANVQSIEGEARHRKNWRDEIYPVLFGDKKAPHEIIVVLNFAEPACENLWKSVVAASKSLSPKQTKIVVFGKSSENYGTDLMGLAIWLSHSRPGKAMPYLSHALSRWNAVKSAQKSAGTLKSFTNEYDATATAHDYPIHYGYLMQLKPPVPAKQEPAVAKYCYDAGNVNMYQAVQVCQYYGVKKLPAVIVDGRVLGKVTTDAILSALR